MTFRIQNRITQLIYLRKYNHRLLKNGFIAFFYLISLVIFLFILFHIIYNNPNDQKDLNLFIGSFTIITVLGTSYITTSNQNEKRNNSKRDEYNDVFEFLRNLNWYLNSGFDRCKFLANESRITKTKTKEELETQVEGIKRDFNDMETRIRNMINASSTFPSPLKNQIFITLDQSMKIFGTMTILGSPYFEQSIVTVFIKTNRNVLLNPFLFKYADEEAAKVMGYCFDWLIYSVQELEILRQNLINNNL